MEKRKCAKGVEGFLGVRGGVREGVAAAWASFSEHGQVK